jgi:hypothetical protein
LPKSNPKNGQTRASPGSSLGVSAARFLGAADGTDIETRAKLRDGLGGKSLRRERPAAWKARHVGAGREPRDHFCVGLHICGKDWAEIRDDTERPAFVPRGGATFGESERSVQGRRNHRRALATHPRGTWDDVKF